MIRSQRNSQRYPLTCLTRQRKKSINKATNKAAIINRKSTAHLGTANTVFSAEGKKKKKKRCLKIPTYPPPLKKIRLKRALFC